MIPLFVRVLEVIGVITVTLIMGFVIGVFSLFVIAESWEPPNK